LLTIKAVISTATRHTTFPKIAPGRCVIKSKLPPITRPFRNPVVLVGIAAVLAAFAASLFGFWELRLPFWLTQTAAKSYAGY